MAENAEGAEAWRGVDDGLYMRCEGVRKRDKCGDVDRRVGESRVTDGRVWRRN